MSVVIRSTVFPLRQGIKAKQPWEISLEISNADVKDKRITIEVEVPSEVTFSSVGLSRRVQKQIDKFAPGETFRLKLPVYLSSYAREGSWMGKVRVHEHFNDFDYIVRTYMKEIPFRIVQ